MNLPEPTAYMWVEAWKDEDTPYGPGDYNEEVVFDTNPPINGTTHSKLYTEEQVLEMLRSNAALRGDSGFIAGVPLESTVMRGGCKE